MEVISTLGLGGILCSPDTYVCIRATYSVTYVLPMTPNELNPDQFKEFYRESMVGVSKTFFKEGQIW